MAPRANRRRSLRAALQDRRGATALVFAAAAVTLFGFAALATEGGNWYYTHRNARSAADMAALAGATAYANAGLGASTGTKQGAARNAVLDTAARNGFRDGVARATVTPNVPPSQGPNMGTASAVEAIVEQRQPTFLTGLLLGRNEVPVRARAVAATVVTGPACVLSLVNSLSLVGTTNVMAPECVLVSNNRSSKSVVWNGNAVVNALALRASGGCFQCDKDHPGSTLPGGYSTSQPQIPNPYADIDTWMASGNARPGGLGPDSMGAVSACQSPPAIPNVNRGATSASVRVPMAAGAAITAICGSINVNDSRITVDFDPGGTYMFYSCTSGTGCGGVADLKMSGGTINCAGCTFIFTGFDPYAANGQSRVGEIQINATSLSTLTALDRADTNPLDGVLLYRDNRSPMKGQAEVQINGGANMRIGGAIVAPNSFVQFNGNSAVGSDDCGVLIGGQITLNGTNGYNLGSQEDCSRYGTRVPQVMVVRLVE